MSVERKSSKLGLILPFAIVGVLLAAWSVWWFVVAHKLETGMDAEVANLRRGGYQVSWTDRRVDGWPFRTFVQMQNVKIAAPSGHAIAMPRLHAEANTYALRTWVFAAPDGLTLTRGAKGDVRVTGQAIRGSVTIPRSAPSPHLALELLQPVFTPAAGAERFPLAGAGKVAFELRPRKGSQTDAEARFEIVDGRASAGGTFGDILGERPFSTVWESQITNAERFSGDNWGQSVRAWSVVGGGLTNLKGELTAGTSKANWSP
ncbi:DUF2125 domain-containing protein, partial [Caulobacter sp. 17J65-9]|uniref:DUF2125 domain-containing protein n=1 Tax=Caulobacter sp. 17J65-9 TaxID=2709382 RepID=UPI0013C8F1B9